MKIIGKDLYADNGKWLYQGYGVGRAFWKSITLASVDNAKFFSECTNEEYLAWKSMYEPEPLEPIEEI